jgi:hypothetical protein
MNAYSTRVQAAAKQRTVASLQVADAFVPLKASHRFIDS